MKRLAILLSMALLALAPWSGRAQENNERQRIRVIRDPSQRLQAAAPKDQPPEEEGRRDGVSLQFGRSSDVKDVLTLYAQLTGQHLIFTKEVAGTVPIVVNERVTKERAIEMIECSLFANGFPLIESQDGKSVQVCGPGQSPAQFPVPVYTKLDEIPQSNRMVKMVFKIQHRDVTELAQRMNATYPAAPYMQGQAYLADPKSQTLTVTERTGSVRQIARLIEQFDVFDCERAIRIALTALGGFILLLLVAVPLLGRRAAQNGTGAAGATP